MLRISFVRAPVRHLLLSALTASAALASSAAMALTISGLPPGAVVAGHAYTFTPTTTDSPGRTLKFSITNKPSWAVFSSTNGRLSGTPSVALVGTTTNKIVIAVSDGTSTAALPAAFITVRTPDKLPPVMSGTPASTVNVGSTYAFQPSAKDPAGNPLFFTIFNKPAWASFNTTTGALSGKPTSAQIGTYGNIIIRVNDGQLAGGLTPFSITVKGAQSADKLPPVMSGTPASSVNVGSAYAFHPSAKDPAGNPMFFTVFNKPAWASFSIATGALTGTPSSAQIGTYNNIIIRVNDGQLAGGLPPFSITVKAAASTTPPTGTAEVMWVPPTENTNGTALTDLAGYRIHYGTSASNLSTVVQVASASLTSYTVPNLAAATWYFAISAYTTTGMESALSKTVSKTIE
jgi:hypothetical protein